MMTPESPCESPRETNRLLEKESTAVSIVPITTQLIPHALIPADVQAVVFSMLDPVKDYAVLSHRVKDAYKTSDAIARLIVAVNDIPDLEKHPPSELVRFFGRSSCSRLIPVRRP